MSTSREVDNLRSKTMAGINSRLEVVTEEGNLANAYFS